LTGWRRGVVLGLCQNENSLIFSPGMGRGQTLLKQVFDHSTLEAKKAARGPRSKGRNHLQFPWVEGGRVPSTQAQVTPVSAQDQHQTGAHFARIAPTINREKQLRRPARTGQFESKKAARGPELKGRNHLRSPCIEGRRVPSTQAQVPPVSPQVRHQRGAIHNRFAPSINCKKQHAAPGRRARITSDSPASRTAACPEKSAAEPPDCTTSGGEQ